MAQVTDMRSYVLNRDTTRVMLRAAMQPDTWQRKLLRSHPHRALVTTSRQSGKSTCCAAMALHRCHTRPHFVVVAVSPTQRQSTLLVSKVRDFAERLGITLVKANAMSLEFTNGSVIYALSGNANTVRGYSPDLLMIDEAAYTTDSLYIACLPMLAATKGDLIAITTPNGRRGWFWDEWSGEGAGNWMRIEVPYTEISRISPDFIAGQKASMSRERFAAEYECAFNSSTFGLFNASDLAAAMQQHPSDQAAMPDVRAIITRNRQRHQEGAA